MVAIRVERLMQAGRDVVDAALRGESWSEPLDVFAREAGAVGATLVGEGPGRPTVILATRGAAEAVDDYLAGRAPPDARATRVNPTFERGFRTDFDDFAPHEIERAPIYVEFLRPRGFGWHATARLARQPGTGGGVFLGLKRAWRAGHYERADIEALTLALPALREAAHVARLRFEGERGPPAWACGEEERAVFALDAQGRARPQNAAAAQLLGDALTLRGGRLAARAPEADQRLQLLLAAAVTPPRRGGATILDGPAPDRRLILRAVALDGAARDLFAADVALLLVDPWRRDEAPSAQAAAILRAAFDLTPAEAKVAALIAAGASAAGIAARLSIAPGTARNHLKSAMAKAGTPRQTEFALLCGKLTG